MPKKAEKSKGRQVVHVCKDIAEQSKQNIAKREHCRALFLLSLQAP